MTQENHIELKQESNIGFAQENSIVFKNVTKAYGKNVVIKDLNLEIKKGERLILLGPSGCGKTTTLRMIAGFEEVSGGEIYLGGKVVNDLPPGERNIAMVFQSYALFPHLSVWDNITFGLQLQKLPKEEITRRANQALQILHLTGYETKKTHELSGGQKQRVALARAIVKHSPYFLLDEPQQALIGHRKEIIFGLRPEAMQPNFTAGTLCGTVEFIENTGNLKTVTLRIGDHNVMYVQASHSRQPLETIKGVDFSWSDVCLFDSESGENLDLFS
ncbi:MAG: ABC transporter ATP-binding protein [Succiniclasticum sp.]|nr:ABC transporter ATP-binding protein [Succiniclasticum sp.]